MTNDDAKFMLRGYRPNGSDAGDPAFAEALAQAERDPALRTWFEREQQFDTAIAAGLRNTPVPAGLRESILAGTRLGSGQLKPSSLPWWIGIAAALVLSVGTLALWQFSRSPESKLASVGALMDVAWADLGGAHPASKHADAFPDVAAWLESPGTHMHDGLPLDFDSLIKEGCRTQHIAGSVFVEVCFRRNGTMFHVYMARRDGFGGQGLDREPMFHQKGEFATACWADARFVYVLASKHGSDAIRAIL